MLPNRLLSLLMITIKTSLYAGISLEPLILRIIIIVHSA